MGVIWALRSDNEDFNARYSVAGLTGFAAYSNAANVPTYGADASAIGGNAISLDRGSATGAALIYPARGVFSNQAISILMRLKLVANGTFGLFEINPGGPWLANSYLMYMVSNWCLNIVNQTPATVRSSTLYGTAPSTGVWIDMVLTWDGSATAGSVKLWLDGTNVASVNPSAAATNPKNANSTGIISIGGVTGAPTTRFLLNEFAIWDEEIVPTSVGLVGGTGSLNGASRTAFVDVPSYDGTAYSDPGEANVRSGTSYTYAGTGQTGTAVIPSLANTKIGVAGDGGTGTYDGSDRWTDPGEGNVSLGVQYKANSETNNKTGTLTVSCDYPIAGNVRSGTSYASGSLTGTLIVPAVSDVRTGVSVDATVGSLDVEQENITVEVEDYESITVTVEDQA